MNDYYKTTFKLEPYTQTESDILSSFLADSGYDSFESENNILTAYIKAELFSTEEIKRCINSYDFRSKIDFSNEFIEGEDWNKKWEEEVFRPIVIDGKCTIYSAWHTSVPKSEYNIIINPKLSFGTGHHETTSMIVTKLLSMDLLGKSVLDMGTGTGILSILCSLKGANNICAIEIDPIAAENAKDNVKINNRLNVDVKLGDAQLLNESIGVFDLLLANINRNIILQDIASYASRLKNGGIMLLSGFYTQDVYMMLTEAASYNLRLVEEKENNNWALIVLEKNED